MKGNLARICRSTYRAAKNPTPGKCWGCLARVWGICERKARLGKLTCWHHQFAERNAQKLANQS